MAFSIDRELSQHCQKLEHPQGLTVFLASFILLGILVSYIPQHIKIIKRRSSEGLSPWFVLLGSLSSIAAIGSVLVLPRSRADMACCKELTSGACAAALLGVAQIGVQWACFMFIVMLFFIFFPSFDLTDSVATLSQTAPVRRRDAVIVGGATLLSLSVVFIISVVFITAFPSRTQYWANVLGAVGGLLSAIQYIPQIYYTYIIRDVKSLSLTTMMIQTPGAFLFAFSLYLRFGLEGWSTWLVFIITGVLQGALFALGVYFQLEQRRNAKPGEDGDDEGIPDVEGDANGSLPTEQTALLAGGTKVRGMQEPEAQSTNRQFNMLYSATPPDEDSDTEQEVHNRTVRRTKQDHNR